MTTLPATASAGVGRAARSFWAASETWVTLALLGATLVVVAWSVQAARWVHLPPLTVTILAGAVVGLAVSRFAWRGWKRHLVAQAVGVPLVYVQSASLVQSVPWPHNLTELAGRLGSWSAAAVSGDIIADTLPFATALVVMAWVAGYLSAWAVFQRRNAWLAILPGAAGLLANLSYLPREYFFYFFLYMLAALVLMAHLSVLRRREQLAAKGVHYPSSMRANALLGAVTFSGLVVAVAAFAPLWTPVAAPVREAWSVARWPLDQIEDDMNRLFSSLPARKAVSLHHFGDVLPIQYSVSLSGDPVFFAQAPMPTYWRVRAYSEYTSAGWKAEGTVTRPFAEPDYLLMEGDVTETVQQLQYAVTLASDSPYMFTPSGVLPVQVDRPANIETPAPRRYVLDTVDTARNAALPESVRDWASRVAAVRSDVSSVVQDILYRHPGDVKVTRVHTGAEGSGRRRALDLGGVESGAPSEQALARALAGGRSVVGVEAVQEFSALLNMVSLSSRRRLHNGDKYQVLAEPGSVGAGLLRQVGVDYPTWVVERYLELPPGVPQRVRLLTLSLTAGDPNPYDKAEAIEDYLRQYQYTPVAPAPPYDTDRVDYFLFEAQEGHSDHFASAMVVLLRAAGIPARLISGYGPGAPDPEDSEGAYVIRDQDKHAWPEAFFPGLGWVEFEPTPIYPRRVRGPEGLLGLAGRLLADLGAEVEGGNASDSSQEDGDEPGGPGGRLPGGEGFRPIPLVHFGTPLGAGGILFGVLLLGGGMALVWLWRRHFMALPQPEAAFDRVCRLGHFLGLGPTPTQTPLEYGRFLGRVVPGVQGEAEAICEAFSRARYGGRHLSSRDLFRLQRAWRRLSLALLARMVEGGPEGESKGGSQGGPAVPVRRSGQWLTTKQ